MIDHKRGKGKGGDERSVEVMMKTWGGRQEGDYCRGGKEEDHSVKVDSAE